MGLKSHITLTIAYEKITALAESYTAQQIAVIKGLFPEATRRWLRKQQRRLNFRPPISWTVFGRLRRVTPIRRNFGYDRGLPIDRYYIERFLSASATDIQGHVLEIGDNRYTCKFGGNRVSQSDVLHAIEGNPRATLVADLTNADNIPSDIFDCVICTQTLLCIYDVRAAIQTLYRILKPGGVLLVTIPGISQVSRCDMDRWGDYWRFTSRSARWLFEEAFPAVNIKVETHGNVLAAVAFLHGLAGEELRQEELDHHDRDYEVLIAVRAVKSESAS